MLPRGVRYRVGIVSDDDGSNPDHIGVDSGDMKRGKGKKEKRRRRKKKVARGYILELFGGHFRLPELGPIGSNGLANARDFQVPVAAVDEEIDVDDEGRIEAANEKYNNNKYHHNPDDSSTRGNNNHNNSDSTGDDDDNTWLITCKFANALHTARQPHTPFDVLGWHGSYYPFKYDLGRFNAIGSISYDHPDPSIFTVLTSSSSCSSAAEPVADFVVFPPRWLVGEDTFRPPWFHRNCMSEFMGLVAGEYDAKAGKGTKKGGGSGAAVAATDDVVITNATDDASSGQQKENARDGQAGQAGQDESEPDCNSSSEDESEVEEEEGEERGGFRPAGASLHNIMSGHGPDAATVVRASDPSLAANTAPKKVGEGSLAFMFESGLMLGVTAWGLRMAEGGSCAGSAKEGKRGKEGVGGGEEASGGKEVGGRRGYGEEYVRQSWLPIPRRLTLRRK